MVEFKDMVKIIRKELFPDFKDSGFSFVASSHKKVIEFTYEKGYIWSFLEFVLDNKSVLRLRLFSNQADLSGVLQKNHFMLTSPENCLEVVNYIKDQEKILIDSLKKQAHYPDSFGELILRFVEPAMNDMGFSHFKAIKGKRLVYSGLETVIDSKAKIHEIDLGEDVVFKSNDTDNQIERVIVFRFRYSNSYLECLYLFHPQGFKTPIKRVYPLLVIGERGKPNNLDLNNLEYNLSLYIRTIEKTWEKWFEENYPKKIMEFSCKDGLYPNFNELPQSVKDHFEELI